MVLEIIQVQGPSGLHSSTAFAIYSTITRDPGILQRSTLLIDCSSQRGTHFFVIDIFDLSLMVLEIIQVQVPSGFPLFDSFCYSFHYNSRSRHPSVKHSINRLFLSTRHIFVIDKFDVSLMVLEIIQEQCPKGISIPRQPLLYLPL